MITNKINTILNNSQQSDIDYTICNYIKMNLKEVAFMSIEELARKSYVSKAKISKFIKKLAYDNYIAFKDDCLLELEIRKQVTNTNYFLTKKHLHDSLSWIEKNLMKIEQSQIDYFVRKIKEARETEEEAKQERTIAREEYITNYPNSEFTGWEPDNEKYDRKLVEYQKNYEPQYQEEFEKQCSLIYKSLRDNVIAKIHGDIKAAHRHKEEINRLLRETNFADSCYQIDIEPADNADGQFYDMLMAEELDTKNPDNDGFEGQLSLG